MHNKGKLLLFLPAIIIFLLTFGNRVDGANTYVAPVDKSVRIGQINNPPLIDGRVREQEWKGATLIEDFVPTHTGIGQPSEKMKAFLGYDSENIYLAVICYESNPSGMRVRHFERDSSVTSDDCIELFFDINYDRSTYYHFAINPAGALYDSSVVYKEGLTTMDKSWNSNAKVKASVGENRWELELAIPFSDFGLADPPQWTCWGLNINRVQRRIREYVSWSVTGGSFHQPKNFGRLIWGTDTAVSVAELDFGDVIVGNNKLSLNTKSNSKKEQVLDLRLLLMDVEQKIIAAERKKIKIGPDSVGEQYLEYRLPSFGDYFVKLELVGETSQLFFDDTYKISLPPPMQMQLDQYAYYLHENVKCNLSLDVDSTDLQSWVELTLIRFSDDGLEKAVIINQDHSDVTKIIKGNILVDGQAQIELAIDHMEIGKYKVKAELKGQEGIIYSQENIFRVIKEKTAEAPRLIEEVSIGKNNSILVNGQPFFPNGLYHVPQYMYPEVKKQGFNAVQIHPQDLDEAHKHGLKGIVVLYPGMTVNLDFIRKTVMTYKDHPAVLLWLLLDEPDINKGSPEIMLEAYHLIKKLDPHHPVSFVLIKPSSFERYNDALDILTTDPYPIPFDSVTVVGKTVDEALKVTKNQKPIWTVLQSFGRYSIWEREPTPYEARAMAYIALNRGVTAFSWYCLDDRPSWWLAGSTQLWSFFKSLQWELEELTPVLAFSNRASTIKCKTDNTAIDYSAHELDDMYYVFVVNTTNEKVEAQFTVDDIEEGSVEELFDNYSLAIKDGEWYEELEPLGVRVYKIHK